MAEDDAGQHRRPLRRAGATSTARLLRHVSDAFAEDPVRILRVARFAARYAPLGFRVADETMALMRQMVADGEANALVAERVWTETEKALGEPLPGRLHQRAARMRRVESRLPGDRRVVRRAAAGEMASGDRHRHPSADGAARSGEARRWRRRALRGAHARSRQGRDTRRQTALASRPRRSRRRAGRAAVRAAAGA